MGSLGDKIHFKVVRYAKLDWIDYIISAASPDQVCEIAHPLRESTS